MNKREMQLIMTLKEEFINLAIESLNRWEYQKYILKAEGVEAAINILKKYVQ